MRDQRFRLLLLEWSYLTRFRNQAASTSRRIVFYSAQAQYISYFKGLIDRLLEWGVQLSYITSDSRDPILDEPPDGLQPFYLRVLFPFVLPFLDSRVVVMTMPDLHQFHIRRSIYDANHVFVFHSLCSSHMGLRLGALDHYDTIFCVGPYHVREIRRTEEIYGLKPKHLVEAGYHRLEKIYSDHRRQLGDGVRTPAGPAMVLIAPSWQRSNILEVCGSKLTHTLLEAGYRVVFRPHPMTISRKGDQVLFLQKEFGHHERFRLDTRTVSEEFIHKADVMISDWSGVALEYALGTERPVLFVDVPRKVHNSEYEKLGLEPIEVQLREQIGDVISLGEITSAGSIVQHFLANAERYRERIVDARQSLIYNFGRSSEIGADYLIGLLK